MSSRHIVRPEDSLRQGCVSTRHDIKLARDDVAVHIGARPGTQESTADVPGEIAAASIRSSESGKICITRNITITGKDGGAIVILGKDHDVGLIISGSGQQIKILFPRVIRRTKVCVAITGVDFQPAELMFEKNVEDAPDRIGTVNGGSAIL